MLILNPMKKCKNSSKEIIIEKGCVKIQSFTFITLIGNGFKINIEFRVFYLVFRGGCLPLTIVGNQTSSGRLCRCRGMHNVAVYSN